MRQIDSAQLVWNALADTAASGGKGLTKRQLCRKTGLMATQVTYALSYIDDVLQLQEGRPRAYHPYWKVYSLLGTWAEHRPYIDVRWKSILTQMKRQEANLTASAMAFTDGKAQAEINQKLGALRGAIIQVEHVLMGGSS